MQYDWFGKIQHGFILIANFWQKKKDRKKLSSFNLVRNKLSSYRKIHMILPLKVSFKTTLFFP